MDAQAGLGLHWSQTSFELLFSWDPSITVDAELRSGGAVAMELCQQAPVDEAVSLHDIRDPSITVDAELRSGGAVAMESCQQAPVDEAVSLHDIRNTVSGEFKYDMGWQKRGSGRCYDSKSGVGTVIGNRTGKICAYDVRSKDCRVCTIHKNKNETVPFHECSKNWDGSSKAMEPDVGAQLVTEIEDQNVNVGVIIMDDDCTTMARIKQMTPHPVEKWSDINHTCKHLGNSLYNLQKKHKCLSSKVIKWLQKCFNYALAQNKGCVDGCQKAIQQIVPHAFGDHNSCDKWCGYNINPKTYKHKALPYGRDLSGQELRADLSSIFDVFSRNAAKIAPGGSTKDVESFNNMVACKAPKRCHYSASKSLHTRVACAVAQKNLGNSYINDVNNSIGLSPGTIFQVHAGKRDKILKRRLQYEGTLNFKRRKLQRKLSVKYQNSTKELREGVTYKTAVATTLVADVTEIPAPQLAPETKHISNGQAFEQVFCDIETTSLHKSADITQIAAVCKNDTFNQYIMPSKPISDKAAEVTGLTSQGNVLCLHGSPVQTLGLKEALQVFLAWLSSKTSCVLVGHNFARFDFPRLIRAFKVCNLSSTLKTSVLGIVDTLPLFKDVYPGLETYRQEFLVTKYVEEEYAAHNALADVESLQKLCRITNISEVQMVKHSVSSASAFEAYSYHDQCDKNSETLHPLQTQKIVSKSILNKIAGSGLCLAHLKLAISRQGLGGLTELLTERVNGKARVTATKRIIESIYKFTE